MKRDTKEDALFTEIRRMWIQEKELLTKPAKENEGKLKTIYKEQQQLLARLEQILKEEYVETHTHLGPAVSLELHWKTLKKIQKERPWEITNKLKSMEKAGRIYPADVNTFMKILEFAKHNEAKAFLEFEKLMIVDKKEHESFNHFEKKFSILGVADEIETHYNHKKLLHKQLTAIAKHYVAQNCKQVEIRMPFKTIEEYQLYAQETRAIEQTHPIKIRFINIIYNFTSEQIERSNKAYLSLKSVDKKYFVGLDDITFKLDRVSGQVKEREFQLYKHSILPVITHAGEFFNRNAPGFEQYKTKTQRVQKSLNDIDGCLNTHNIYRIGHANVLGLNVKHYLKHAKAEQLIKIFGDKPVFKREILTKDKLIKKIEEKQLELIKKIKQRGVIIETNPTSNLLIRGLKTYKDHPIATFKKHGLKFSINTDDRVLFNTNLRKEYFRVAQAMDWSPAEIKVVAKMSRKTALQR